MAPDGSLVTLVQFDGYNGANPQAPLIEGTDGNLYGTTTAGGPGGQGTIFRLGTVSALQITSQPASQSAFTRANLMFSVAAIGSPPLSWQWQKNKANLTDGGSLSGSTNRILGLANVTVADSGTYSVIITNMIGSVTSADAVLQVTASPPIITSQPANQTLQPGATATFTLTAIGTLPLSYQWQVDGANLTDGGNVSGSTTGTLTLSNVIEPSSGTYSVIVSNTVGWTNASSVLTVIPPSPPCTRLSTLASFAGGGYGTNLNGLIQGTDGNFYGTAEFGGAYNLGTVFKVTPDGTVSPLASFAGTNGANPRAALVQGMDGDFYGTTWSGGASSNGTVFRMAADGTLTTLVSFSFTNGANPQAALVQGAMALSTAPPTTAARAPMARCSG